MADVNVHHLVVCITVAVLVFSVVIVAGVFISRRKRTPPTVRLTALPPSDSNHRYSTYVIDVPSRDADDYEALINTAQVCQKGGSSTDTKRIIDVVTSELGPGACADPKATGSKQTPDASKDYCSPDGYLEPDDDRSIHDYAYPTPVKSYTYQTSEVDSCSSQAGEDGYMVMNSIPWK